MNLDHDWIAAHIPHQADMCLLDCVSTWDENCIVCTATSHTRLGNPLRAGNALGIVCGIEYAAQAMAIHGALLAGDQMRPQIGFLTSVREVIWHCARLDNLPSPLVVSVERISGNTDSLLYGFNLTCDTQCLLQGRASVMLTVPATALLGSWV